ncbi:hypothetical protein COCC4DRAFT_157004 [Bipolaris maydis ATCC 48331]|uniref:Uncharacterized protein n=2 Tax=Cochliobolus heterostrophus TaxID=5016 RepID=M2TEW1_COCH5|nr:uncharacterized protein COCC4DRAFT_157004 [Bipolaris maydis ATCC 48331]EMD95990.1 hypothetical protein COCHEDRAFT_1191135 [Bipolaris maydis C5]KAH7561874.1 hypothetical protein BM1_02978 [Bipolaris maydis]ENI10848.1 hypothetical protein COCC4DRAFT_157004 [Bipolaris maydis ATCC 48331]KAJ5030696.1 hypothetical protein J3E73DRAFT_378686 [Bipolaris maydis]KAJ5065711.1 hypothetical protein J3E74DRAFT_414658 [Bipolaris maydis]
MESQLPPPPASAILAPPSQHHQPQPQYYHRLSSPAANCDYDYDSQYSEKEHRHHSSVHSDRLSRSSNRRPHDSVISHPFSPKPSSPPSPSTNSSSSISSVGHHRNSSNAHRYSSSQLERQSLSFPPQAHIDPEKHAEALAHGYRVSNRLSAVPSGADAIVYDKGAYQEKGAEEKAWQLLLWLCGPCAFLSGVIAIWTFCALFITILLSPLRLCTTRAPLSEQIKSFLAPSLNLQLHMVYSHDSTSGYSAPMLVVIHLFSPIVAFGVAIAAWTAAGFWFFSCILGDPGGHDGHNDGRESIVGVRNWWERWLSRGLRETDA